MSAVLSRFECQAHFDGNAVQAFVVCPQFRSRSQSHAGEQMDIDISDPTPKQGVMIDEMEDFPFGGNASTRQTR
jgi:hypothetical protein